VKDENSYKELYNGWEGERAVNEYGNEYHKGTM
jgi:hypothetical protein